MPPRKKKKRVKLTLDDVVGRTVTGAYNGYTYATLTFDDDSIAEITAMTSYGCSCCEAELDIEVTKSV